MANTQNIVIFENSLSTTTENISEWFTLGDFFYLQNITSPVDEFELDCFLNIRVANGSIDRVISLDDASTLNIADTERIIPIPLQVANEYYQKRLIMIANESIQLKVSVVTAEKVYDTILEDILDILDSLSSVSGMIGAIYQAVTLISGVVLLLYEVATVLLPGLPPVPGPSSLPIGLPPLLPGFVGI